MAYDDINLKSAAGGVDGGESEKLDRILKTGASINESTHSSTSEAPEYACQCGGHCRHNQLISCLRILRVPIQKFVQQCSITFNMTFHDKQ